MLVPQSLSQEVHLLWRRGWWLRFAPQSHVILNLQSVRRREHALLLLCMCLPS